MTNNTSITNLFYQLVESDPSQRDSTLVQVDSSLVPELESYLAFSTHSVTDIFGVQLTNISETEPSFSNTQIDRYFLEHELGRGGFGVVYKAKRNDYLYEKTYAVKVFFKEVNQLLGSEALLNEAQLLAQLKHSGISQVYDAGVYNGQTYLVLEYVEGLTLGERLDECLYTLNDGLVLIEDLCSALEHVHQHGIIHGDLKPENILITPSGSPKLIDFNLTQNLASDEVYQPRALTRLYTDSLSMTQSRFDTSADIYALGRIMEQVFSQHSNPNLRYLIYFATRATRRYQSIGELKADLINLRKRRPMSWQQSVSTRLRTSLKQSIGQPAVMMGILCLSVVVSAYYVNDTNQTLKAENQRLEQMMLEVESSVLDEGLMITDEDFEEDDESFSAVMNTHYIV